MVDAADLVQVAFLPFDRGTGQAGRNHRDRVPQTLGTGCGTIKQVFNSCAAQRYLQGFVKSEHVTLATHIPLGAGEVPSAEIDGGTSQGGKREST